LRREADKPILLIKKEADGLLFYTALTVKQHFAPLLFIALGIGGACGRGINGHMRIFGKMPQ
jgi:hypothetical protein